MRTETIGLTGEEFDRVRALRHDLHMNPELSGKEVETTRKVREFLAGIEGCTVTDLPLKTGLVAQILANSEETAGHEVMLRADMDALPQTEMTDIPWKSQIPGIMHACGHDLHTAALCGAALVFGRLWQQGKLENTIDLVFQPAEEGTTGARMLIDAGLFDVIHPDVCFGLHNWPSVDTGMVVCRTGALMSAKRNFEIILYGAGGHGSMPHLNKDPIVCAGALIQSLQTVISRNTDPLEAAVLSVNMIRGGSPVNLVVDQVHLGATVRALSGAVLDKAIARVEEIVRYTALAYECSHEIVWKERIPSVWNSPEMTTLALRCAAKTGLKIVEAPPSLASEDFALYREYVPSFFFWTGSREKNGQTHELHTPLFFADDDALRCAAELFAACGKTGYDQLEDR